MVSAPETIAVEVVYAQPTSIWRRTAVLPATATVGDALAAVECERQLQLAPQTLSLGIFGARVKLDAVLHDGDRIEIYRPLAADAKEARRRRAAARRRGM